MDLFILAMTDLAWYTVTALAVIILIVIAAFIRNRYFNSNSVQKQSKKLDFDLAGFYSALGGRDNIISVESHQSRLILELVDYKIVNLEKIKGYGASGVTITSKKLTLVIGSKAETIKKFIQGKIKKKKS